MTESSNVIPFPRPNRRGERPNQSVGDWDDLTCLEREMIIEELEAFCREIDSQPSDDAPSPSELSPEKESP